MEKMAFNFGIIAPAALVPLIVGFIWYNPKVFGNTWMTTSGMTEEKAKGANMPLIMGLSFIFNLLVGMALAGIVIHQNGVFSIFDGNEEGLKATLQYLNENQTGWHDWFRTFKHGALHGFFAGLFIAMPVIGTGAIYERRGFKFIAVSAGYWVVSMSLMGGVICAFS